MLLACASEARELPGVGGAQYEITLLMLKKSTDVARIKFLPVADKNEILIGGVVTGERIHPRLYCEVKVTIKGDLKVGDRVWFEQAQGPNQFLKKRLKPGDEYIAFFTTGEWGKLKGLVLLDNWVSLVPYDSSLEEELIWIVKHPDNTSN